MRIKNLFEAEVKPGERKGMSLKIKKLETLAKKIEDYQSSASTFGNAKVPDSVAAEYEKVKQGILIVFLFNGFCSLIISIAAGTL